MCFFVSLIPATMLMVIGFFVLFAAGRAEGTVRTVGKVLGTWLFVLALLPLAGGTYMTVSGKCPMGGRMMSGQMGSHMIGHESGCMGRSMDGEMDCPMAGQMEDRMDPGAMMAP